MTVRAVRVIALAGAVAVLPLAPGLAVVSAHAQASLWPGLPAFNPPGPNPPGPPVSPGWPGLFGGTPPTPAPPGPGPGPGFLNMNPFQLNRVTPPVPSTCQVAGAQADLVFTAVLSEGGRRDRGRDFEFWAVTDLLIEVRWHKLSAPARQRVELYTPNGFLYQMFTTPLPADPEPVVVQVPVRGSWITSSTLVGTWCAKVFLDDGVEPVAADDFDLKLRSPGLGAAPQGDLDLVGLALEQAGQARLRARGGSMHPAIRDGDVVSMARTAADELGVGDVVCYAPEPGRLTLHRVVGREAGCVVTKGDALDWVERVPVERVLAKVTGVERRGRLASLQARVSRLVHRLQLPG